MSDGGFGKGLINCLTEQTIGEVVCKREQCDNLLNRLVERYLVGPVSPSAMLFS